MLLAEPLLFLSMYGCKAFSEIKSVQKCRLKGLGLSCSNFLSLCIILHCLTPGKPRPIYPKYAPLVFHYLFSSWKLLQILYTWYIRNRHVYIWMWKCYCPEKKKNVSLMCRIILMLCKHIHGVTCVLICTFIKHDVFSICLWLLLEWHEQMWASSNIWDQPAFFMYPIYDCKMKVFLQLWQPLW